MDALIPKFKDFLRSLKRGENAGTFELCRTTCAFLYSVVKQFKIQTAADIPGLIVTISTFGKMLSTNLPLEIALVNIVRRVLHIVREEAHHKNIEINKPSYFNPWRDNFPRVFKLTSRVGKNFESIKSYISNFYRSCQEVFLPSAFCSFCCHGFEYDGLYEWRC